MAYGCTGDRGADESAGGGDRDGRGHSSGHYPDGKQAGRVCRVAQRRGDASGSGRLGAAIRARVSKIVRWQACWRQGRRCACGRRQGTVGSVAGLGVRSGATAGWIRRYCWRRAGWRWGGGIRVVPTHQFVVSCAPSRQRPAFDARSCNYKRRSTHDHTTHHGLGRPILSGDFARWGLQARHPTRSGDHKPHTYFCGHGAHQRDRSLLRGLWRRSAPAPRPRWPGECWLLVQPDSRFDREIPGDRPGQSRPRSLQLRRAPHRLFADGRRRAGAHGSPGHRQGGPGRLERRRHHRAGPGHQSPRAAEQGGGFWGQLQPFGCAP